MSLQAVLNVRRNHNLNLSNRMKFHSSIRLDINMHMAESMLRFECRADAHFKWKTMQAEMQMHQGEVEALTPFGIVLPKRVTSDEAMRDSMGMEGWRRRVSLMTASKKGSRPGAAQE
jgi:hypothetical protein